MNTDGAGGVYRRCGCTDPLTGKRLGGRCPRLEDLEHGSWYFAVQVHDGQPSPTRIRRGGYRTARKAAAARDEMLATVATAAAPAGSPSNNGYCAGFRPCPAACAGRPRPAMASTCTAI
jgi:hypothetical protein